MKHFLFAFYLISATLFAQKLPAPPQTDERIELLSIVFRLAGAEEYSNNYFKKYTDRIDAYFTPYKNHELIAYIKDIRHKNGIGYDAVMSMAISIGPAPDFKPLIPFDKNIPEARWGKKNAEKFVVLLRKFYSDTKFDAFYKQNSDIYETAAQRFKPVFDKIDLDWYEKFYGKAPNEEFNVIIGTANGGGNYGPAIKPAHGNRKVYAIMGTWDTDSLGGPVYGMRVFSTLVHEFNHSFINYLSDKYERRLKKPGKALFSLVKPEMQRQAYGNWKTVINEANVRAAVIVYMKQHGFTTEEIQAETIDQINRGFFWIEELVAELEKYDASRSTYPALELYMPQIVAFYEQLAQNAASLKNAVDSNRPHVTAISGFKNGAVDVDPGLTQISVTFDRPMGKRISMLRGEKGEEAFPQILKKPVYSDDKRTVIVDVKLEPGKDYQFILSGMGFKSEDGYGMNDYEINFSTKK